jgi:serine/threonine protein kinase
VIRSNPEAILYADEVGKTALDLALEYEMNDKITEITLEIIRVCLPIDHITGMPRSPEKHGYVWTVIVQSDKYAKLVEKIITENLTLANELARATDPEGRPSINIASPLCQKIIKESTFFYRRYEITTINTPHHMSATCMIHLANDHGDRLNKVAIKFMSKKDQFLRELNIRDQATFDEKYVLGVIRSHSSDTDLVFLEELHRRGFHSYPYCIVMSAAEKNLQTIVTSEHFAGRDWHQIKIIATEIAQAVGHMHHLNVIHGDIKPLNIMRAGQRMKLIDLDSAAVYKTGYAGAKYSSAYAPPEFFYNTYDGGFGVKKFNVDPQSHRPILDGLPYQLLPADYSFDCWALGCVLYELCSGSKLFPQDDEDNIDEDSMMDVFIFSDEFKRRKLQKIHDKQARNLVAQLLNKVPSRRPRMDHILVHPFISGRYATRMVGDEAEFDVFISYRVASDKDHAELLYNILTAGGLRVWWDRVCLLPGVSWTEGFCDGLVKSRVFMPILSKGAINHPSKPRQSFASHDQNSPCDNVLLEHNLALEFHQRGLVEKIYPVLVGDKTVSPQGDVTYGNYFADGAHPVLKPDIVVAAVELQLEKHLDRLCLGSPLLPGISIEMIVKEIMVNQGKEIQGSPSVFNEVLRDVQKMI